MGWDSGWRPCPGLPTGWGAGEAAAPRRAGCAGAGQGGRTGEGRVGRGRGTAAANPARQLAVAEGRTEAVLVRVPTPATTRVVTATGAPGAYGHPAKVTTCSPG